MDLITKMITAYGLAIIIIGTVQISIDGYWERRREKRGGEEDE